LMLRGGWAQRARARSAPSSSSRTSVRARRSTAFAGWALGLLGERGLQARRCGRIVPNLTRLADDGHRALLLFQRHRQAKRGARRIRLAAYKVDRNHLLVRLGVLPGRHVKAEFAFVLLGLFVFAFPNHFGAAGSLLTFLIPPVAHILTIDDGDSLRCLVGI